MRELRTRIKPDVGIMEQPVTGEGKEAFLVAALAATLVEHRRYVKQRNGNTESGAAGQNWRMVSRLEQLQG
jgi:hypothetical protein